MDKIIEAFLHGTIEELKEAIIKEKTDNLKKALEFYDRNDCEFWFDPSFLFTGHQDDLG